MIRRDAITLKQLRAFEAVCETGSITAGAEQLSLSPPAVHTQLKLLETHFETKLLDRTGEQGMMATEAGEIVLAAQAKILAALEVAADELEAMNQGLRGFVRFGVVSTGKYFAPFIVAHLKKEFPDIDVELFVGNREEVIRSLTSGRLDFAIMGRPPILPGIVSVSVAPHPHVLIASLQDPLAAQENVSAQDILGSEIMLREEGSGTRILAMRFLDRIGEGQVYASKVMQSNETIKQAVLAGLGIAFISAHTVLDELKSGKLKALTFPSLPIPRRWYVVSKEDVELSKAKSTVQGAVLSHANVLFRVPELAALGLI